MYKATTLLLAQNYEQESNKQERWNNSNRYKFKPKLVSTYSESLKSKTVIKNSFTKFRNGRAVRRKNCR